MVRNGCSQIHGFFLMSAQSIVCMEEVRISLKDLRDYI